MRCFTWRQWFVTAGVLAASAAWGKVDVRQADGRTIYDFSVEDITFKTINVGGKDFVAAKLSGVDGYEGIRYEVGKPELPVVRMIVDGDVVVQSTSAFDPRVGSMTKQLKPSQPGFSKSMKFPPPVTFDVNAYQANRLTGAEPFTIEKTASVRGVPRMMVTLYPFAYNAASNTYRLRRNFRVAVKNAAPDTSLTPTIALVVGQKFAQSPALVELENLKHAQGFRTQRITVGENGIATDVSIRSALQALLKGRSVNLRYAILVGDAADVPSHAATNISGVTDHFYRAIDTANYETDINGPDIGVGRISVASEQQLGVVVDKIDRYIKGQFGRDNWLNMPAFVTTHDRSDVAEGTHNAVIAKHFAPRGYDREFPDNHEKGGDKLFPISLHATAMQIVDHMSRGRMIINYSGHGSHTGWEDVTTADVNKMADPDALPYVIANACITGDFREEPAFSETWLREPNGAIVYWGSMDSSYWDEDDILERSLYDGLFEKNIDAFDLMHQNALTGMWQHYGGAGRSKYYWETYTTFGDPSLELRTGRPVEGQVEGMESIVLGSSESLVRVTNGSGKAVGGAMTVLRRPSDGVVVSGVADAQGEAHLDISGVASSAEGLELTVGGSNLKQISRSVPVVAANAPYFGFKDWRVNGRALPGVHVGERVDLNAAVENFGLNSKGGRIVIASVSGPVQVTRSEAVVPSLAQHGRSVIGQGLSLTIGDQATNVDIVLISLRWESAEGSSGIAHLTLPVLRATLSVESVDYGSPDIEGIATSGDLYLTVKNTGNELLHGGVLHGIADSCTTAASRAVSVPDLAPGSSIRLSTPLTVTVDPTCQSGAEGKVRVLGRYQGGARSLDLQTTASYLVGQLKIFREHLDGMNTAIPDAGSDVVQTFKVSDVGALRDISIAVDITHTYVGDLVVSLVAPSGQSIVLRNGVGGTQDNLVQRWGHGGDASAELDQLAGSDVRGDWKVLVKDTAAGDVGTWNAVDFVIRHW